MLFKNGELQSRSRDEYVDELYPELVLKDEPQKYDDAWLSLIDDVDDCSLMLVSRKIIDGIGVCMMFDIVSELWLLDTIDAWCRGDIGGSDLIKNGKRFDRVSLGVFFSRQGGAVFFYRQLAL